MTPSPWYARSMTTFAVIAGALVAVEPLWVRGVLLVAGYLGTLLVFQRRRPTAPIETPGAPGS